MTTPSGETLSPCSTGESWKSGGGKQTPLTDDASRAELNVPTARHRPPRQSLKSSMTRIWGGHDVLDPVMQCLGGFCTHLADTVDDLTTDVLTLRIESRSRGKDSRHATEELHGILLRANQMIMEFKEAQLKLSQFREAT